MPRAKIVGSGVCLGPIEATNNDVASFCPPPEREAWTPSWVELRLGIKTRRSTFDFRTGRLVEGYHDSDMAYAAAHGAIEDAGMDVRDVDRVIYATSTPDQLMPDPACVLHGRLGITTDAPAVGLTSVGCGGFIYAMDLADAAIRSGKSRVVLIVGSVSVGPYIAAIASNPSPEERAQHLAQNLANIYIFGEAAGALVLQATETNTGIRDIYVGASNRDNPVDFVAGGSRRPATHATVSAGLHRFNMNVASVRRHGPGLFLAAVRKLLDRSDLSIMDFDYFVFHQVNVRLLDQIADSLGIDPSRLVVHVDRYGNLDTATLPVAFHEARRDGRIRAGHRVLFAAVGAGWQFGAAIVHV